MRPPLRPISARYLEISDRSGTGYSGSYESALKTQQPNKAKAGRLNPAFFIAVSLPLEELKH
jgi:hypothetical protein